MKVFKRRPGVELLEICGEYLLVATGEARGICPYVTQINSSAAEYWRLLDKQSSVNELLNLASSASGKEKKELFLPLLTFIDKFNKSGYLMEETVE